MRRVLVVRLRSVGDAVLATPSLHCLRRFLPAVTIDVVLEDGMVPLLSGSPDVDEVLSLRRGDILGRVNLARLLRQRHYDVAIDLHGGPTASLLTFASRAPRRVGYRRYQCSALFTHRLPASTHLWGKPVVHSVEEQLALLGGVGVPVSDRPPTRLPIADAARARVLERLAEAGVSPRARLAVMHPGANLATRRWAPARYAEVARGLRARDWVPVVAAGPGEEAVADELLAAGPAGTVLSLPDLGISDVVALVAQAGLFVGNDSGIAHIAAAVRTPAVVVFMSSNVSHWRPWTTAPAEVVRHEVPCAPCPGYTCDGPVHLACHAGITPSAVIEAVERVLASHVLAREVEVG